jgi:biotin carboxyl carrier protein
VQYEVEVNHRIRQVSVRRADGRFVVGVDGRECTIDVARIDAHTLSLLVGTSSYDVSVVADPASGQLALSVGAVVLGVSLNGRRRWRRREDGGHDGDGPHQLKAPMPGKIVRVLVKAGEAVRQRQPLVVIEAMKMENELRAARDGVVAELHVAEGQSVDAGALVAVVVPA